MRLKLEYLVTGEDNHVTLGDFLKRQKLSNKAVIALKHHGGGIFVNGIVRTTRWLVSEGDVVAVIFGNERVSESLKAVKMDFEVIYEDDFLLVVDKKANLPVIPTGDHGISLANGILAYYEEIGLASTVHFVNRLDKDTSGLLIVAKYRHIHHLMTENLAAINRKYYALVTGNLTGSGRIKAPIFRPAVDSIKRVVDERGQFAVTHYEVAKNFADCTLVRCTLETGRTHQIRVHMAHLGHPILKDPLYGNPQTGAMQLLHSYFLEFNHPISGQNMCFETDIPVRFGVEKGRICR